MQLSLFPVPSRLHRAELVILHLAIWLRSRRSRWNARLRPYLLLFITLDILVAGIASFLILGASAILPLLADAVPLLIAIVGIIMSYRQPKQESHFVTTVVLIVAGLAGTFILSRNRILNERAHKDEVDTLNRKIESVGGTNGQILGAILDQQRKGQSVDEATRRERIVALLRNEYILSHSNISPGMLAGTESPPADWINKRLHDSGERWTVTTPPPSKPVVVAAAPEERKAHIEFSFYTDEPDERPIREVTLPVEDSAVTIQMFYYVTGDVPAKPGTVWIRICKECSYVTEPNGFSKPPDQPMDRQQHFPGGLLPNVVSAKIEFRLMPPVIPRLPQAFDIGCYYACENCPVVNPKEPQRLVVKLRRDKIAP